MLACVCQPTDPGIFRRSPIPLGAPPLKFNHKGAIPKPGRTLRIPVITNEPKHQFPNRNNLSSSSNSDSSRSNTSEKRKSLNDSDKKRSRHHHQIREAEKCNASVNKSASASASTTLANSEGGNRKEEERRQHQVGAKGTEEAEREEITLDSKELPGTNLKSTDKRPIRKLNDFEKLPEGVQLTLSELREMACRQQAQIDSQHQLLAAKEQRLRYLKEQEARQQRVQAESERLRRLRDRVDAQELKLRKLRAIRGQVDHQKQNNLSLTSDLDSIRALFNEKEKELSLAVAKVEELTRQLEELRRGRSARDQPPASALELDKLRRELMYRNKLNEQQNQRLNQQREALTARQEEMSAIDKRISELQERLHRKRLLNQQLANQISATSHKAAYHQLVRLTGTNDQNSQGYPRKAQHPVNHTSGGLPRSNIAAVEPYNHVPLQSGQQQTRNAPHNTNSENTTYHPVYQQQSSHIKNEVDHHQDNQELSNNPKVTPTYSTKQEETDILKDFAVSKSDPKYQTLPYNTKFTVNIIPNKSNGKTNDPNDNSVNTGDLKEFESNNHISSHINANMQSHCHTVHSAPLSVVNKNIATPLNQNDLINRKSMDNTKDQQYTDSRNSQNGIKNVDNSGPITTVNNNVMPPYQKPISSVAPTSVHNNGKISNIYQTASIKVQPVEPQTVLSAHKQLTPTQSNVSSPQSLALSPPQSASTPLTTPETSIDKTKPALPPKPAIKPPPRQTQIIPDENNQPPPLPTSEPPSDDKILAKPPAHVNKPLPQVGTTNQNLNSNQKNYPMQLMSQSSQNAASTNQSSSTMSYTSDNMPIIKAKPLTIKKQPMSEQPKLRSLSSYSKQNGLTSRRIEMPPTFHFPESTSDKSSENESSSETSKERSPDETDKTSIEDSESKDKEYRDTKTIIEGVVRRCKKGNLKQNGKANLSRRVSFDPLALLLDASLEGELELVRKTASQVPNPSAANDEGITALHNAICAGHLEIVKFLVEFGCDVNAQDSDGWTPLHCAASCNNVAMVKFLVEHGACIFATTLSDHETAAEKCEEDEEGFDGCSEYLYSVQEKLGILSGGVVYAVFDYSAQQPDELTFTAGQQLTVLRKGDENEREWWWSRLGDKEGYIPRNLLGLYPRVTKCED